MHVAALALFMPVLATGLFLVTEKITAVATAHALKLKYDYSFDYFNGVKKWPGATAFFSHIIQFIL